MLSKTKQRKGIQSNRCQDKKKNVQKRETLPWENTHCDLFEVLKILERRTLAYITLLGYEMLFNAAKLCIDNSNFKFVPLAEGSRTGEWCASHPAACCGQPQVYPACRIKWFRVTSQTLQSQNILKKHPELATEKYHSNATPQVMDFNC